MYCTLFVPQEMRYKTWILAFLYCNVLQHYATYSNTLLLKATKMSSNIRIQRIYQHCEKEFTAKTTVTKNCSDDYGKRVCVAVVLFPAYT